jgi:phage terminase small subunit
VVVVHPACAHQRICPKLSVLPLLTASPPASPGHFQASDLPLLVRYVEASVLAEQAASQLRLEGPVVAGRVSPWVTVQEKSVRALVALSMRLRLSPQARAPNNPSRPPPQVSHYEKMSLGPDD